MKLRCVESVQMRGEKEGDKYLAFTEGKTYLARKGEVKGLNGDPYGMVQVLCAKNDRGESHIIKKYASTDLDEFFAKHFEVLQ